MKRITFEQFIKSYNFRHLTNNPTTVDGYDYDTSIIRIYFDDETNDDWFEFGIYNFGRNTWGNTKKVLNPKILNMYVYQFKYDIDAERFEVRLTEDKEFECDEI